MGRLPRTLTLALTLTLTPRPHPNPYLNPSPNPNPNPNPNSNPNPNPIPNSNPSLIRWIGFLGDQTLYTHLASSRSPRQGGLVYTLPCEWNRQVHVRGWVEGET